MGHERGEDVSRGWLYVALAVVGVAYLAAMADITSQLEAVAIPFWVITIVGGILLANSAIGKAIGRRITGDLPEAPGSLDVPDEVYAELDELRARMLEMEERQQFAERLLTERIDATDVSPTDRGGAR